MVPAPWWSECAPAPVLVGGERPLREAGDAGAPVYSLHGSMHPPSADCRPDTLRRTSSTRAQLGAVLRGKTTVAGQRAASIYQPADQYVRRIRCWLPARFGGTAPVRRDQLRATGLSTRLLPPRCESDSTVYWRTHAGQPSDPGGAYLFDSGLPPGDTAVQQTYYRG